MVLCACTRDVLVSTPRIIAVCDMSGDVVAYFLGMLGKRRYGMVRHTLVLNLCTLSLVSSLSWEPTTLYRSGTSVLDVS